MLAFIIIAGLLGLFGQRFGLSHRFPGSIEEGLIVFFGQPSCGVFKDAQFFLFLVIEDKRLCLLPLVLGLVSGLFEVAGQFWLQLIGKLRIASELIIDGIVIGGPGHGIGRKVEDGGIDFSINISFLMVDEATVVGPELGLEGSIGVDIHSFALLI